MTTTTTKPATSKPTSTSASSAQKGGTTKKHSAPGTAPLPAGVSLSQPATSADVTWLAGQKLPSAQSKQPPYGLSALFTDAVVTRLTSADVSNFYGSAIAGDTLQADVDLANAAAGARNRFEASTIAAGRIYGVPGQALAKRVSLIMARWSEFEATFPDDAAALDTLRTYWLSKHKTGPHKSASTATAAAAPATPATPATGTQA